MTGPRDIPEGARDAALDAFYARQADSIEDRMASALAAALPFLSAACDAALARAERAEVERGRAIESRDNAFKLYREGRARAERAEAERDALIEARDSALKSHPSWEAADRDTLLTNMRWMAAVNRALDERTVAAIEAMRRAEAERDRLAEALRGLRRTADLYQATVRPSVHGFTVGDVHRIREREHRTLLDALGKAHAALADVTTDPADAREEA